MSIPCKSCGGSGAYEGDGNSPYECNVCEGTGNQPQSLTIDDDWYDYFDQPIKEVHDNVESPD